MLWLLRIPLIIAALMWGLVALGISLPIWILFSFLTSTIAWAFTKKWEFLEYVRMFTDELPSLGKFLLNLGIDL